MGYLQTVVIGLSASVLLACGGQSDKSAPVFVDKAALGEALFHDVNLSFNRSQSCATCHNPEQGFVDNRLGDDDTVRAVSLGDDGVSLGDRNAPSAAYALLIPPFSEGSRKRIINTSLPEEFQTYTGYLGGQFWDGRASVLKDQSAGPPLNRIEMGMPDKTSVVARLRENSDYEAAFKRLFAANLFDDVDAAYAAMAESIAAFEKTETFAPFDSKYDRSLLADSNPDKYTYDSLDKASTGQVLFFSSDSNCAQCHQLNARGNKREPFSSFEYHNIGVPKNTAVRLANGKDNDDPDYVDTGLKDNNSAATEETDAGKFRVPGLRNVAITGPYMHNGVFQNLDTVIKFYDSKLPNSIFTINPETEVEWAAPEVADNISDADLLHSNKLDQDKVDALVCFLRTLTDKRYEHLLPDDGLCD